jgi:hypothetical protein
MLTFDQLPSVVASMNDRLDKLTQVLQEKIQPPKEDELLTLENAAAELDLLPATLAIKARARKIRYTKRGRHMVFYKSYIEEYLKSISIKPRK